MGHYRIPGVGTHAFWVKDGVLKDLGTLGGKASAALAISSGRIVGSAQGMGGSHAFLWRNGVMTNLGIPGRSSSANAVNALGQIVGYGYLSDTVTHGFLWQNGAVQDLGPGRANGINRSGWIVGAAAKGNDHRATLWTLN